MPTVVMRTLHQIRLRGPWGCQPVARFTRDATGHAAETTAELPPGGRVVMPSDWTPICGAGFHGRVRFRRRFHWPSRLTPRERVWLVFDAVCGSAVAQLNDGKVGDFSAADAPVEFDVTGRLAPTNILLVDVTWPDHGLDGDSPSHAGGGLTGEVRLEVRSATKAAGQARG